MNTVSIEVSRFVGMYLICMSGKGKHITIQASSIDHAWDQLNNHVKSIGDIDSASAIQSYYARRRSQIDMLLNRSKTVAMMHR
jgi:ABC-type transporter Mla subunit MlaD